MGDVRPSVQDFLKACDRLLGFANANGGLTDEECRVLFYYSNELQTKIYQFCSPADETATLWSDQIDLQH
ncbi:MAG TPA: hypothetical protein VH681_06480 [Nitrospiraceae bacterium]